MRSKYNKFKDKLEQMFPPGELNITGERARGATGEFEVTVEGKLVHSKKNGDGYPDNGPKLAKIEAAIKAAA